MGHSLLTCFSNDLCHGRGRWLWAAKSCLCHEPAVVTGENLFLFYCSNVFCRKILRKNHLQLRMNIGNHWQAKTSPSCLESASSFSFDKALPIKFESVIF